MIRQEDQFGGCFVNQGDIIRLRNMASAVEKRKRERDRCFLEIGSKSAGLDDSSNCGERARYGRAKGNT